ncbi:ABC transporter ATP-binding protein [Hydrogenoanaerobacterium sp.]|uniref:energy-coupling factor ABC transporter ATP-binding protein n=1 Tax=Hydrogenoanaerobacterium sp. TaxID=2953763 RepID=UPI0028983251|nr:ABC transporter ATP-binding protein [Hydrogenoanaerobacterium sp.]
MIQTQPAIEAADVCYRYPKSKDFVIKNASFAFYQGEFTAITGENGAGKTTLAKLCTAILKPASGKIEVYGENIQNMQISQIAADVCYCFQHPSRQLFAATVEDEVAFALRYKGASEVEIQARVQKMLELFGLSHLRKCFPLQLSGGEQQRLAMAAGLALKPRFLLLDEPTACLDTGKVAELSALLKQLIQGEQIGVAVISHDNSFVQKNADKVLTVRGGTVYAE